MLQPDLIRAFSGAVALIVANSIENHFTPGFDPSDARTIPVVGVSAKDRQKLLSADAVQLVVEQVDPGTVLFL